MRHIASSIAALAIASLLFSGCVAGAPESDDGQDTTPLGEAQQPLSTSVLATYSATTLPITNGKKIVYGSGAFHAVYDAAGAVLYTSSTDGLTWTAPVTVDANTTGYPSIAIAADGTVFVSYLRSVTNGGGAVYVARKLPGLAFDAWFKATSGADSYSSREPSMVADGNVLHLTWTRVGNVHYLTFPVSQTTPLASAEVVHAVNQSAAYLPAILAGPAPGGSKTIRVSFYNDLTAYHILGLETYEKVMNGWTLVDWRVYQYNSSAQAVAVSADINPSSGDTYVAHSHVIDGQGATSLLHESALVPNSTFSNADIDPSAAKLISVAARNEACQSRFRIMTSMPYGGHGTTTYRTGTWTSGAAPSWIDPSAIALPGSSRAGTALMQALLIPDSISSRFFVGTFEDSHPNSYRVLNGYQVGSTPAPCE